jgi:hypothetical protein
VLLCHLVRGCCAVFAAIMLNSHARAPRGDLNGPSQPPHTESAPNALNAPIRHMHCGAACMQGNATLDTVHAGRHAVHVDISIPEVVGLRAASAIS